MKVAAEVRVEVEVRLGIVRVHRRRRDFVALAVDNFDTLHARFLQAANQPQTSQAQYLISTEGDLGGFHRLYAEFAGEIELPADYYYFQFEEYVPGTLASTGFGE